MANGLVQKAQRVLLLTGTPILNKPIEMQPLLAAIAPEEFGNFFGYAKRYCAAYQKWTGRQMVWDFSGASNLPELQERLRSTVMVRRLKADVLKELPAKRRQVVTLAQNGAAEVVRKEQQAWERHEDRLADLRATKELAHAAGDTEAYNNAVKALQTATTAAFEEISRERHKVAVAKVPYVVEHVRNMLDSGVAKVVVFVHHHDVVASIETEFSAECVVLTGETPMNERQDAVDRFQTDPACRVFIGSITAAGVGLTLTAASNVVFAELDWVPANVTQAEDRCHRIGQTDSVLVQHLVLDGSLDARMAQVIIGKQAVAGAALDNATTLEVPVHAEEEARPAKYPVASAEQRAAAKAGIKTLRAYCDGACTEDGMGFSKITARVGHSLAKVEKDFTDGQVFLARRICRTHRRQLPVAILAVLGIEE